MQALCISLSAREARQIRFIPLVCIWRTTWLSGGGRGHQWEDPERMQPHRQVSVRSVVEVLIDEQVIRWKKTRVARVSTDFSTGSDFGSLKHQPVKRKWSLPPVPSHRRGEQRDKKKKEGIIRSNDSGQDWELRRIRCG